LWEKKEKEVVHMAMPQKVQQKELKRVKEGEAAHVVKPQEAQQEQWRRSPVIEIKGN